MADRQNLLNAHSGTAAYLRDAGSEEMLPDFSAMGPESLSVVCFRCGQRDSTTQELLQAINESGTAHVSSTRVSEKLLVRLVFLNYRTAENRLQRVLDVAREFAKNYSGCVESLSDCA